MLEKNIEKNIKNKPVLTWEREARKILNFRNMLESVKRRCYTANTFVYKTSKNWVGYALKKASKIDSKIIPKSIKNRSKIDPKSIKNRSSKRT